MGQTGAINRCLKDSQLERMRDLDFLIKTVRESDGELDLSFRDNRCTVYFTGNVLATVSFRPEGLYRVDFQSEFVKDTDIERDPRVKLTWGGSYPYQDCDRKLAHVLLQQRNIGQLKRAIRNINNGEEITYEQFVMADTPPTSDFLIIDHQVTDPSLKRKRMDLLALTRGADGRYGFVVLEIKLGKNPELSGKVADQLQLYVDHLRKPSVLAAYSACYERAYRQKRELGLLPDGMPAEIRIGGHDPAGIIVSCGYAQKARKHIDLLAREHPGLRVIQLDNDLTGHIKRQ